MPRNNQASCNVFCCCKEAIVKEQHSVEDSSHEPIIEVNTQVEREITIPIPNEKEREEQARLEAEKARKLKQEQEIENLRLENLKRIEEDKIRKQKEKEELKRLEEKVAAERAEAARLHYGDY